jgi:hypothetical protein
VEHRGFSVNTPSWLYTRRGTIGRALRPAQVLSTTPPIRHPRTGPPRYRLQTDLAQAPWSSDLAETFHPLLGTDRLGVTAITLLSNSLAPYTYANYSNALRQLVAFCTEENIAPLQATPATMIRYTAWLALLGTVAASSLQPYFSAVNKYIRDHQRQPIVVGELLADARRGLETLQHRLVPADTRLPLPAPVALDIVQAANTLRDGVTWSPATRPQLERFRACLALCVKYTFFCRAETGTRCQTGDLIVDIPSQQICLFVRKSKGDQRRDTRDKLVFAVPITANPILADLLDYYTQHRAAFCATYNKRPRLLLSGASHLRKTPPNGGPRTQFPPGSPSHFALSTRPRPPVSSGHRTTSGKGALPLPTASTRPSPSSNTWVAGPRPAP